jgi:uncharacterized membrane protein
LDLYPWIVFVHAATILLFFIAHGASMAVALRLRREQDPDRIRALLDLSRFSLGTPAVVLVVLGLLTGIAAGFLGGWWGSLWIWISLVLFMAVGIAMTPMMAARLNAMRSAAGLAVQGAKEAPPPPDDAELRRLIDAWNPVPIAVIGIGSFVVILWLMMEKPF